MDERYGLSLEEFDRLSEIGRRMACQKIMTDPEARARVELTYGLDYCRNRYPEAYQDDEKASRNP